MNLKLFFKSNYIGIIIGVFGILLSLLFYFKSKKEREPVYSIKKEPSVIYYRNSTSQKLKVVLNDSIIVKESVFVSNVVIWNNGELEIEKKDVRKNFIISISGDSKILDYKIVNQTHPDIGNFKVKPEGDSLLLDWDYFDPMYGVELQIIYSGDHNSGIIVNGSVLGNNIKQYVPTTTSHNINLIIHFLLFISGVTIIVFVLKSKDILDIPWYFKFLFFLVSSYLIYYGMKSIILILKYTEQLPL